MRTRWWLLPLVVLLAIPLALLLRGFARDVLVLELLRLVWGLGVVLDSVPQTPIWWLFLGSVVFLSVLSLIGRFRPRRRKAEAPTGPPGEVHLLASRIHRASEGDYFRWNLLRELGRRALEVLAYKEQTTAVQLRKRLDGEGLDAPPDVEAYIRTGQAPIYSLSASILSRFGQLLSSGPMAAPPEQAVERIVEFMEDRLEVTHDS